MTPRGPLSLPPGGAHWYELAELGYPPPESFLPTYRLASEFLDGLVTETGVPAERTVLGGFSQGSMMSYALGLGADRPRPAGVLALSGFFPEVEGLEVDLTPPLPPIAIGHGIYDPVIGVEWGRNAKDRLEQAESRRAVPRVPASARRRSRLSRRAPTLAPERDFRPFALLVGRSLRLLLTSAGIKNTSIHDALVDLLGKPIAESSALCIPTASYAHPMAGPRAAWRFISGQVDRTPMCELGWKSLGVLELTALPSIDEELWVPWFGRLTFSW